MDLNILSLYITGIKKYILLHNAYLTIYHLKRRDIKYIIASGSELPILYKLAYLSSMLSPQLSMLPYLPHHRQHKQQRCNKCSTPKVDFV